MVEMFFPESLKIVLASLFMIALTLSLLAKKFPEMHWLQVFRFDDKRTEAERKRAARAGNRMAGLEMIIMGFVVVFGYMALTVFMFNDFEPALTVGVGVISLALIGLGIYTLVRNHES
jgi:hypothetical protein